VNLVIRLLISILPTPMSRDYPDPHESEMMMILWPYRCLRDGCRPSPGATTAQRPTYVSSAASNIKAARDAQA